MKYRISRNCLYRKGFMINHELLKILACPACQGDLLEQNDRLVCKKCGRKYPVKEGIPVLLVDEADK
ncbi:MAG: Trm112 family protein [Candidatus Omnitrophota bacterium]